MGHERSNTVQDPSGRWINIYGQNPDEDYPAGVSMGLTIPLEPGVSYPDAEQAVAAAKIRSQMHVPHDEMTLSEMLQMMPDRPSEMRLSDTLSPEEIEALSQPRAERLDYPHNLVIQSGPRPPGGMYRIPNYNAPHPPAFPYDREAPPQRNRDMYGGKR